MTTRAQALGCLCVLVALSAFAPSQKERPVATRFKGEFDVKLISRTRLAAYGREDPGSPPSQSIRRHDRGGSGFAPDRPEQPVLESLGQDIRGIQLFRRP